MLTKQPGFYTPEEYLVLEQKADYKSEYHQGEIVALAGASLNHNRIVKNTSFAIDEVLASRPCETFIGDVRLWIEKKKFYTYPDIMIICGKPEFVEGRTDTITNPKVIIEVLSESTAVYDRGDKFRAYWNLDGFEEYVLIDQERIRVEYFRRVSEKEWKLLILTEVDDLLSLASVAVEVPLAKIYRNVTWEVTIQPPSP
ncbi:MAG: Uma2 family endonuclease, partial [Chloroflexota bacterium]